VPVAVVAALIGVCCVPRPLLRSRLVGLVLGLAAVLYVVCLLAMYLPLFNIPTLIGNR
jgi:hypothetical protein